MAEAYAQRLNAHGIEVPFNTVPPALRDALAERGVMIGKPEKGNAGKASMPAFEQWVAEQELHRQGDGAGRYGAERQAKYAQQDQDRMVRRIRTLADKLHLDNVEIITDVTKLMASEHWPRDFIKRAPAKSPLCYRIISEK